MADFAPGPPPDVMGPDEEKALQAGLGGNAAVAIAIAAAALGGINNVIAQFNAKAPPDPPPVVPDVNGPPKLDIEFEDVPGYGEQWESNGASVRRRVQIAWKDAADFPKAVLGDVTADGGKLKRTLPLRHPFYAHLFASECNLVGAAGYLSSGASQPYYIEQGGDRAKATFEITYRSPDYAILPDDQAGQYAKAIQGDAAEPPWEIGRWVIKEYHYATEAISIPGNYFQWKDPHPKTGRREPIAEGFTRQSPFQELRYTWVCVPEASVYKAVKYVSEKMMGSVNLNSFDGYDPQTLLCLPPKMTPFYYTAGGTKVRNVQWVLLHRRYGWNRAFLPSQGKFCTIVGRFTSGQPYSGNSAFFRLFHA